MNKLASSVILILCLAVGVVGTMGIYELAYSQGSGAPLDAGAGPAPPADSDIAVAETHLDPATRPAVAPPSDSIDDPVKAPAAAFDDVKAAKKTGWTMLLLVVLIMALRGLGYLKGLSFLARDRVAIVIGGAITVATALYDTLVLGGTWVAALYAAAAALAIWWRSAKAVVPAQGET